MVWRRPPSVGGGAVGRPVSGGLVSYSATGGCWSLWARSVSRGPVVEVAGSAGIWIGSGSGGLVS